MPKNRVRPTNRTNFDKTITDDSIEKGEVLDGDDIERGEIDIISMQAEEQQQQQSITTAQLQPVENARSKTNASDLAHNSKAMITTKLEESKRKRARFSVLDRTVANTKPGSGLSPNAPQPLPHSLSSKDDGESKSEKGITQNPMTSVTTNETDTETVALYRQRTPFLNVNYAGGKTKLFTMAVIIFFCISFSVIHSYGSRIQRLRIQW